MSTAPQRRPSPRIRVIQELLMHITIDDSRCQGHGLCRRSAPDLFAAREEDGHAVVTGDAVATDREADAVMAADSCPELAIRVD